MRHLTNVLHLLAGMALLLVCGLIFREVSRGGRTAWQKVAPEHSEQTTRADTTNGDLDVGAANLKTYGVLAQLKAENEDRETDDDSHNALARRIISCTGDWR